MKLLITILFTVLCFDIYAKQGPVTNLQLPRFVSLKSNDVNLRVGPSVNYSIELKSVLIKRPTIRFIKKIYRSIG